MRLAAKPLTIIALGVGILGVGSNMASATPLRFDLTCVLNGLNSRACVDAGSFGTVTLVDMLDDITLNPGEVRVTVDLAGTGHKFRDLMLNLGPGFTSLSSSDGQAGLSYDGFSISPYNGLFDVGQSGGQGWNGSDLYSTILSADSLLSTGDFNIADSLEKVYVALHIQNIGNSSGGSCTGNDDGTTNCVAGQAGSGSLKIGGLPTPYEPQQDVPEPSTSALIGGGILALLLARRRGKA